MPLFQQLRSWYHTYEQTPRLTGLISLAGLGCIGILAFLWRLGSVGLIDETEPMFADAAQRMLATGDWITPYYNDTTRFDKPPLIYWLMAIAYRVVGVNAWGARLPSAFAALGLMVLTFLLLRRFGYSNVAALTSPNECLTQRQLWLAAWIGSSLIALNIQMIVWARQGVSDMLLNGCFSGGLICFFYGYGSGGKAINRWLPNRWYIAAYALFGGAVLAKGPVGIVVPGLVIICFLLYLGKLREVLWEAKPVAGALIFSGVALPWFILVTLRNGQAYIDSFFGYHNIDRFTGVVNGHDAPLYFYIPVILVGFLPWSVYLPAAIARLKLHRLERWRNTERAGHLGVFATIWFAVIFAFFTVAVTKLPSYTIPLLPAGAILVALFWSPVLGNSAQLSPSFRWSGIVNMLWLLILAASMGISPRFIGYDPAAPELASRYLDSGLSWLGLSIWLVGAALVAFFLWRRSRLGVWFANSIVMIAFITLVLLPAGSILDQARQAGLREIAHAITVQQEPDEDIMMIGFEKPSLVFYSDQTITFVDNDREDEINAIQAALATAKPSFLLVIRTSNREELPVTDIRLDLLLNAPPYELLRVSQE